MGETHLSRNSRQASPRFLVPGSIASLTVAFALLLGPAILCCDPADDERRRERIESMYSDYKKGSFPGIIDVEPRLAMALAKRGSVVFVDVRTPEEQRVSMIPGAVTDVHFLENVEKYKDDILIGYCTISYRSGELAKKLREERGITMYNLRGGLLAWAHDGGKVVDQQGETKGIHVYERKWNLGPTGFQAIW
jgi:sodium/bile acid cotransporter 7